MAAQGDNLVMHIKLSAYPLNISHYCTWILTMLGLCVGPGFFPVFHSNSIFKVDMQLD